MAETAASLKERSQGKVEWAARTDFIKSQRDEHHCPPDAADLLFCSSHSVNEAGVRVRACLAPGARFICSFFFFFSKRLREERVVCLGEGGEKRTTWRTTVRTLCAQNLPVASVVCVRLVCVCVFFSSDASREKKGRCEVDGTRSSELSWVRWPEPPLSASFPEKKRPERERKREGSGEEVCAGCRGFQLLVSGSLS